jgi:hypothetical protein
MTAQSTEKLGATQAHPLAHVDQYLSIGQRAVSAHEAFMKAIDKDRFKKFLPSEEQSLGNAAGAVPNDEQRRPGNFVKPIASRGPR